MQSNFCRMGNQTSRFKPLTAHRAGGERHPLSTLIHSVTRGSKHHQSPHLLWAHLLSSTFYKATHCMTQSKALGRHGNSWLSAVLSASLLSSTCFCRDPFAGFCFLDGGCQCFRGMKARFSCVRERRMCWRLHFPRKRCTVQLLLYKIKQF